jgi:hypothetical protein
MGSLGDNLLKLTEFPFSYSLIGLLALIFGEGLNLGEASLEKLGPLLILMGFVATTLAICDPIGRLQKYLLLTGSGPQRRALSRLERAVSKHVLDVVKGFPPAMSSAQRRESMKAPIDYPREDLRPDAILFMHIFGKDPFGDYS